MLTAYWRINDKLIRYKWQYIEEGKGKRKMNREAARFVEREKKVEK